MFDPVTGFYIRSGILDNGIDTGVEPFMASFPELIDIGIMGTCEHGTSGLCFQSGVQCYQSGSKITEANMSLENFQRILAECRHKAFQVALGGRGDPDTHLDFATILAACRDNDIVPNYTTSGFRMNSEKARLSKIYCGAVAVSWHGFRYTSNAIQLLLDEGVKTNIHYVLSRRSLPLAIQMLSQQSFPPNINAIVFLLHKPIGLGTEEDILTINNPLLFKFFNFIDNNDFKFKIGFDSCSVPGLLTYMRNIDPTYYDACEAARWSMYISSDMRAFPCSFDKDYDGYDISEDSIQNAWWSERFIIFRNHLKSACPNCVQHDICLGGCPILSNIVLCKKMKNELN